MTFNTLDALLLLLLLIGIREGWKQGFLFGVLQILRGLGSVLAGWAWARPLANGWPVHSEIAQALAAPLAFLLVSVGAGLISGIGIRCLLARIPQPVHCHWSNQLAGIVPGAFNGLLLAALAAALLLSTPLPEPAAALAEKSTSARPLAAALEPATDALLPIFEDALAYGVNRGFGLQREPEEAASLPFKVESPRPRPDLEAEMLEMLNRERITAGRTPLRPDEALREVSRKHSADMFARRYFAHVSPDGKSPFDRLRAARLRFLIAGENLALAPTLRLAHTGLMNSPGHRRNILQPRFGRVGIGILDGGLHGLMITQTFRD